MGEGSCEPPPDMVSCTETFKKWYRSTCTQETGWNYKNKAQNKALKCKFSTPAEIEKTPLACKKKFGQEKRVANYLVQAGRSECRMPKGGVVQVSRQESFC